MNDGSTKLSHPRRASVNEHERVWAPKCHSCPRAVLLPTYLDRTHPARISPGVPRDLSRQHVSPAFPSPAPGPQVYIHGNELPML